MPTSSPVGVGAACLSASWFLIFSERRHIEISLYLAIIFICLGFIYLSKKLKPKWKTFWQSSDSGNRSKIITFIELTLSYVMTIISIAMILVAIYEKLGETFDSYNMIRPPILAESFHWPKTCTRKQYGIYSNISPSCRIDKYYMGTSSKYGFKRRGRGPDYYYRVGNDAISFGCRQSDPQKSCKVYAIEYNVFAVRGPENAINTPMNP